jgi:hypothetical protein
LQQYLERHAEPEAALAAELRERYEAALVMPALGENEQCLDGLRNAARELTGRLLVVLVVNARKQGVLAGLLEDNERLLRALYQRRDLDFGAAGFLVRDPDFDLVVLDRSSPGRELPPRQGVGLARKIGCDLVLSLFRRGGLELPLVFWTDADASLPRDYFAQARRAIDEPSRLVPAALLYPFRHAPAADEAVTRSTFVYESCLRYHVLGLFASGSPYAHHSLGSALAVELGAYASVRGVPKRQAGEDFYLLDKLAKLGAVITLRGEAVSVAARLSARVPFGTGPRVDTILREGSAKVASPAAFRALAALIRGLDLVALERRIDPLASAARELDEPARSAALAALAGIGLAEGARIALSTSGADLRRRLHTWFDALRTLQALHLLRDAGLPDVEWDTALTTSWFSPRPRAGDEPERVLELLRAAESELPRAAGRALLRV